MSLTVVTPPAAEPVTTAEVKTHTRISTAADDALIALYITSIRQLVEQVLNRTLVTTVYDLYMDGWNDPNYVASGIIYIPAPPLTTTGFTVSYVDTTGATQVVASTEYRISHRGFQGRLSLKEGKTWPQPLNELDSVIIRFTAGYGAAADVPEQIKTAIKQMVAHVYDQARMPYGAVELADLPLAGLQLILPYRVMTFGPIGC